MIVVSDTSPLHYLVLIGADDLLPQLFGRVIAPSAVIHELSHPHAPQKVRDWASGPPDWLEIRDPATPLEKVRLGLGESAAIAIATELAADTVLIDERDGVKYARNHGLFVTGLLGVLQAGATRKLISLDAAIQCLSKTSFRRKPGQLEQLLEEFNESADR